MRLRALFVVALLWPGLAGAVQPWVQCPFNAAARCFNPTSADSANSTPRFEEKDFSACMNPDLGGSEEVFVARLLQCQVTNSGLAGDCDPNWTPLNELSVTKGTCLNDVPGGYWYVVDVVTPPTAGTPRVAFVPNNP